MAKAIGANTDLTEAICRAHDLGHPPFGHAGETVLAECMAKDGGFEHNAQTLRIVDLLEVEYPGFPGLNLTWEVREGIARHGSHPLADTNGEFLEYCHPSLEAQLCDLADAIAYGCHDLDDGLAAGLIQWSAFEEASPVWWVAVRPQVSAQVSKLSAELGRRYLKRYLVNLLVSDAITVTSRQIDELGPVRADDVRCHETTLASFSPEVAAIRESLHQFLSDYLYRNHVVETMRVKSQRLVRALFEAFYRDPTQLPPSVLARVASRCPLKRVICDYIAEMTDRAAVREYRRLFEFDTQVLP
jgi:dGTPase